jgi:two-component system, chemotaxis family, chemotaxis protein CheY
LSQEEDVMAVDLTMPILVVEDSKTMGQIIRNLLMLIGFRHVENVSDGTTALARLREKKFGLVISDWNMQPMTGYMLLKEVRADPMLSHVPFVMVTAESTLANVMAAKDAGVSNYIVKPFNGETFKNKISEVFGFDISML